MTRKSLAEKAARLVMRGGVAITYRSPNGAIVHGLAKGSHGEVYNVTVDPAGYHCTCTFGKAKPGRQHSHTMALLFEDARQRGQENIEQALAPYAEGGSDEPT